MDADGSNVSRAGERVNTNHSNKRIALIEWLVEDWY